MHRFSSLRRSRHSRTPSASSQMSTNQAETNILSADLVLKVDIIRGRNLNREEEVNIQTVNRIVNKTKSTKSQIFRIHLSI